MSRRTIIVVVFILAVLGIGAVLIYETFGRAINAVYENIVDDAAAIGEDFLQALKESDYDTAYFLLHPDVQDEMSGPDALGALFPPTFDTWEYEADIVTTTDDVPAVAMTGILTLRDGSQLSMQLILVLVEGENRVAGFSFQP
jgi:hypothetical protein